MDHQLLEKFFQGKCSSEEQARIIDWYLSGKADKVLSDQIETLWREKEAISDYTWGKEGSFKTIINSIPEFTEVDMGIPIRESTRSRFENRLLYYIAIAAMLCLMITVIGYVYLANNPTTYNLPLTNQIYEETENGQKSNFHLPDGTFIMLNSGSRVRYDANFMESSERVVFLEGEAFFNVAEDSLHPFKVYSDELITTVLGTSFNMQAFPEEEVIISLASGRLRIESQLTANNLSVYLEPGEQGVYSKKDKVLTRKKYDSMRVLGWKSGILYFKNERFSDVLLKLERWYGVKFDLKRKGIEDGFSGTYTNQPLNLVLEGLSFVLGFEYEVDGKTILIK